MDFKEKVASIISEATELEKEKAFNLIEVPPSVELGDYAFPCFVLTKRFTLPPDKVAEVLAEKIKADFIESVSAEGPYLNFKIKSEEYAQSILSLSTTFPKKKHKIMIEFSQPNTHKEFHVGHLRNAALGDSLVRILRFTGSEVIPANYIGDIGTHVAKTLWCLDKFHKGEKIEGSKGKYLGKIYIDASKRIEENESFKEEVSKVLQDLEAREPEVTRKWAQTREWSIDEFKAIYKELGIKFDKYYFESEEEKPGKEIAKALLDKGIAEKSEGALIVNLEKFKLGVAIVLKSDGTTLYLTKDLSLGQKKFNDFGIDESIYVVDARQALHLKQVFKILELMGFDKKMVHVSYEFVSTKEGPISSRKGNVYLFEDLKERLVSKVFSETKKRHSEWDESKIKDNADKITFAGLKFGMLKMENNKEIVFEDDKWLVIEGETGPYLLYTYARLNSVMKKSGTIKGEADFRELSTSEDRMILRLIEQEKNTILDAAKNYKPSVIARYLIELCQKTNEYYHKHQVLKEKDELKNARLKLFGKVMEIIKRDLELLGIEALEEM